ncbi:monosaccharide ABC transporter membrane protein, CUT2 family [Azospirillum oryzae]|uniref:Monosaccharide ABC transporter membrane protein, CUT2 family n=1 Tax=Azospirillum oryzae TaxID=286727 RepID=A0A1X7DVT7_9PROT|nr:ABC transporter permease [Azospirillum oryzae]SMF22709.1 monosaccharide ABC transporter membrane protein, CUT2 family [Azospirillum oryzae]
MKAQMNIRSLVNRDNNIVQLLVMTVLIFVVMTALSPDKFLRYYNFESLTYIFPELGLLSIAMMIAMLTGGIDLSVVGVANLSGILAGVLFHKMAGAAGIADTGVITVLLGVVIALGTGLVAGTVNGLLITRLGITPILATLGTGQVFTGLAIVLTGGPAIVGFPAAWAFLGNGKILGLATPFVLFAVIAVLIAFLLSRTAFGINLMLIGTNPKAALFAGLKRERMVLYSYMLTGVLASVAGIILSGRTNAAKSDYGTSYLLQAVLIAVLGGTNPAGGRGTVLGITIAVVALMLLSSGFQILRFSNHLIDFIWGAFLLLVIAINAYKNRTR